MKLSTLYRKDETGWLEQMAKLILEKRFDDLDYQHLREYLNDMAKRDRREVYNRLAGLLSHLLKWCHQPRKRSRSWDLTMLEQRRELRQLLDSKTLWNHALEILPDVYKDAVKYAMKETDLSKEAFPAECQFTLETLLADE